MHRSESSNTLQSTDTGSFIGDDRQSLNGEPYAVLCGFYILC